MDDSDSFAKRCPSESTFDNDSDVISKWFLSCAIVVVLAISVSFLIGDYEPHLLYCSHEYNQL